MSGVKKQNLTCEGNTYEPNAADTLKCVIIVIVMTLIIVGNVCCLIVFNSPKSRRHFMKRVRYMMNSLCCTDLCIGLLVCPSTIYPALYHCWPPGEVMCKIEALLISALFHESTLNMVLIAIDRYCIVHIQSYNNYMNSRRFLIVILSTWIAVFSCYAIVIFAGNQYYYDVIGINCEPYYENADVTVSVISIFYFLPAAIFIFCYASIYRTATKRKVLSISADDKHGRMVNANIRTSKYLAAITAGFFLAVSPWTLCTLMIVTANVQLNIHVDYAVTWLALSNSFWNCLIYGVMNRKFRRAAMRFICGHWIKSLRGEPSTVGTASRSLDESKDFSEDTSAYAQYKRKISRKHLAVRDTSSLCSLPSTNSPRSTPRASPLIRHTHISGLAIEPHSTIRHSNDGFVKENKENGLVGDTNDTSTIAYNIATDTVTMDTDKASLKLNSDQISSKTTTDVDLDKENKESDLPKINSHSAMLENESETDLEKLNAELSITNNVIETSGSLGDASENSLDKTNAQLSSNNVSETVI